MRIRRCAPVAVAAATLLLVACGVGSAAAATNGTLTGTEYYQLSSAKARLKTVNVRAAGGLSAAILDCEEIQEQTPLLTQERSDCAAQLRMTGFTAAMQSATMRCAVHRTVSARLRCLLPVYERLYAQTAIFYHSESKIRQIARARGLPGGCTNVLADPPHVVSLEKRMLDAIGALIRAVKAGNLYPFEEASGRALTAISEVAAGQQANKGQLSLCPHQ